MRTSITKEFTFDAAHDLPNHAGKCQGLHGHTYRVLVTLEKEVHPLDGSSSEGMVVDFAEVKKTWKEDFEPYLDHQYLNKSLPLPVTTAEMISRWILDRFRAAGMPAVEVTVYETPTGYATSTVQEEDSPLGGVPQEVYDALVFYSRPATWAEDPGAATCSCPAEVDGGAKARKALEKLGGGS